MIDEPNDQPDATPDNFAKIYGTILDSSIWEEPHHTVRVWITMLVMADPQGVVRASYSGLRRRAGVSMEELAQALTTLEGPDPDSRDGTDGVRVKKIKGGWFVINAKEYRDLRTKDQVAAAERAKRFRERHKRNVTSVTDNGNNAEQRTEGEGELEVEEELQDQKPSPSPAREIKAEPWDDDPIVLRFCRSFENPESWQHLLAGYREGLGLSKGRATQAQIAQACLEAEALGGDITPRRFRRIVEQVMEKPEQKNGGNTLRAGEIIRLIQSKRNPQFPGNVVAGWLDGSGISTKEIKAVNAIGLSRILNDKNEGIVLAQLAKMLGEAQ